MTQIFFDERKKLWNFECCRKNNKLRKNMIYKNMSRATQNKHIISMINGAITIVTFLFLSMNKHPMQETKKNTPKHHKKSWNNFFLTIKKCGAHFYLLLKKLFHNFLWCFCVNSLPFSWRVAQQVDTNVTFFVIFFLLTLHFTRRILFWVKKPVTKHY